MTTQPETAHQLHLSLAHFLGINPIWVASIILFLLYALLITEKINRSILAILGASLMVILGVITQQQAIAGIDFNTLALLTGMMIIVNITSKCGIFQYVAIKSAKLVNANPVGILLVLSIITAVFSAALDNVTTVLLIAPITLLITDALNVKVFPYFFAEIIASNIGGTATLIGDPPNIIIGSAANLSFNDFLVNLAPIVIVCLIVIFTIIYFLFRRSIQAAATPEAKEKIMNFDESKAITNKKLMYSSLLVLFLVLVGFILGHHFGIEPGTSALTGAGILLLLAYGKKPAEEQSESIHHVFSEVEWITIFFFAGLFVVVAGVEHTGLLDIIGQKMLVLTDGDKFKTAVFILWVSGISSALLDNIPFVATMIPLIQSTQATFGGAEAIEPLWWALALGACLGGNGSLIGASANLTVAAYAEKAKQPISFKKFALYAFPLMLITLAIANVYIWLRYF